MTDLMHLVILLGQVALQALDLPVEIGGFRLGKVLSL